MTKHKIFKVLCFRAQALKHAPRDEVSIYFPSMHGNIYMSRLRVSTFIWNLGSARLFIGSITASPECWLVIELIGHSRVIFYIIQNK
jgi:hypothetical protein